MSSHPQIKIQNILLGGDLSCASIIEQLAPNHWAIVLRIRDYTNIQPKTFVSEAMHFLNCKEMAQSSSSQVYANIGAGLGEPGLIAAKEALRPCYHQQIYKFKPTNKLDKQIVKHMFI